MYNEYADEASLREIGGSTRFLFGGFWGLLLFPFILGLLALSLIEGLSKLMILYGFLVTGSFLVYFLYHRMALLPEVVIYFVWVIWSLSGFSLAVDRSLYLENLLTVIQMGFLLFVISGVVSLKKNVSMVMFAIIIGGLIILLTSLYTGELLEAGEAGERTRAAGLVGNANGFAYYLLFVVYAVFYFWKRNLPLRWRITLMAALALCALGIVYSGSRTGIIGFLVFLSLWWIFCSQKKLGKHPIKMYALVIAISLAIYKFVSYVLFSSYLGQRIQDVQDTSSLYRWQLYKDGVEMIINNPIFGVGLNNFSVLESSGRNYYAHSNYIELASTTGIVGCLIFLSIYYVVWRRLSRIKKIFKEPRSLYTIGLFKAAILTILIQSFSTVNYYSKLTWIFLAAVIGYTWSVEKTLSRVIDTHKECRRRISEET